MFIARIDGTLTATVRHDTLQSCRFLVGQRLDADGVASGEPLVILDRMGARRGSIVIVSTDGDIPRKLLGNTCPARLTVLGLVDEIHKGGQAPTPAAAPQGRQEAQP
ncbi:MAG: EutN/CcmL family microcompartment protein [Bryobacteraceae bacterium]|nr:EutN/CcmL family microcompartment protein [Bryobacteraceae bacterium]